MKVLVIVTVASGADIARIRDGLADELRGSWELFAEGVLREAYATESPARVVFILEAESGEDARQVVGTLPLVEQGLFSIETIELHPFTNWSRLFGP